MPRFYFPVDYDGFYYDDDRGEEFSAPNAALEHAEIIARELSSNNSKSVTVFAVSEDRSQVIHAAGAKDPSGQEKPLGTFSKAG